ncbi:hypothetical protein SJ05684_b53780 (plasmid) [Sinorhizobium sojae CCBAU 05684]|uniref:Uncharacterized protein n=1 Tax=Sinorhizobium sojae CCBAU 05684 TaxID=716928 RepID=A0A249PK89_9HYPH|nr:hypothetical protein SJ05684_b53780 [Sinorhizobium sojae CCBAU 05684]
MLLRNLRFSSQRQLADAPLLAPRTKKGTEGRLGLYHTEG